MRRDHKIFIIALFFLSLILILSSCGKGGGVGANSPAPFIGAELVSFPTGSVPLGFLPSGFNSQAVVHVIDDISGAPITNAIVTMNGVLLTYNATNQDYETNLTVDFGGSVALSVMVGGNTYTASGTQFTSYPAISVPASGATWPACLSNTVSWSGGTPILNASFYGLGVLDAANPNGPLVWPSGNSVQTLSNTNTSYSITGNSLTAGNRLVVLGIASEADVHNAAPGSVLIISGFNYTPITIINAVALGSISISPTNPTIFGGTTQQFTALGHYCDGSIQDLTMSATWNSSQINVATVSNGNAAAVAGGTTTITATSGSISGSTTLTVLKWTLVNSGATIAPDLRAVAWSGSQLAAVGDANTTTHAATILTSPDALTWTTQKPPWAYLYSIAWLGTQFVAVGQGPQIFYSPDGVTWTSQTSGTYNPLTGIAWSGTKYVAVGSEIVLTSPDSVNWTQQIPGTTNGLSSIVWSGTQFVTVGMGFSGEGEIITSPDGVTWTWQTSGTSKPLYGIAWSGSQFVAVGEAGIIITSPDSVTWTSQTSGTTNSLFSVAWSGSQFMAVGNYGTALTSSDGMTWTQPFPSGRVRTLYGVVSFGTRFVAVGEYGTILVSP